MSAAADQAVPTSDTLIDEAGAAAAGTRRAALWIASALGSVPSLAILAAIVRDPGRGGFDPTELAVGVLLAALGALIGVMAFAHVITPIPLEDRDLEGFDFKRVPGQPYATFAELSRDMDALRRGAAEQEYGAAQALVASTTAQDAASKADDEAAEAERDAEHAKRAAAADAEARAEAAASARARADGLAAVAKERAGRSMALAAEATASSVQLKRRDDVRREAYRLLAADEVASRFGLAQRIAFGAVTMVSVGVIMLGLAPEPDPETRAAAAPTLTTLRLSRAGQSALGCTASEVQAIRVGGPDDTPLVITLPTGRCASRSVAFKTADPAPFGSAVAVEQIEAR